MSSVRREDRQFHWERLQKRLEERENKRLRNQEGETSRFAQSVCRIVGHELPREGYLTWVVMDFYGTRTEYFCLRCKMRVSEQKGI